MQTAAIEFDSSLFEGTFTLSHSIISNNSVLFYAVIATFYSAEFNININNCNFNNNNGESIGAVFAAFHFYGDVNFTNSIFQGNKVNVSTFEGGSVAILYGGRVITKLNYVNCFISNLASMGGALFIECPSKNCIWNLKSIFSLISKLINFFR